MMICWDIDANEPADCDEHEECREARNKRIIQARIDRGCPDCGWPWSVEDIKQDRPRIGSSCTVCTDRRKRGMNND